MIEFSKKQRLISLNENYREYKRVFALFLSNIQSVIQSEQELDIVIEEMGKRHVLFSYLDIRFEAALGICLARSGKPFGKIVFSRVESTEPKASRLISTLYFNDIGNAVWDVHQKYPDMNIEKGESAHHLLIEWLNQFLDSESTGPAC